MPVSSGFDSFDAFASQDSFSKTDSNGQFAVALDADPFASSSIPSMDDPFAEAASTMQVEEEDLFATAGAMPAKSATSAADPFAMSQMVQEVDPFASFGNTFHLPTQDDDVFGGGSVQDDPFGAVDLGSDPFAF